METTGQITRQNQTKRSRFFHHQGTCARLVLSLLISSLCCSEPIRDVSSDRAVSDYKPNTSPRTNYPQVRRSVAQILLWFFSFSQPSCPLLSPVASKCIYDTSYCLVLSFISEGSVPDIFYTSFICQTVICQIVGVFTTSGLQL